MTPTNRPFHFRLFSPVFLPFFLFAFIFAGIPPADVYARDVTVGVYENAPKVFTDENGKPAGIFIDIIQFIAEEEGWNLHYKAGTWAEGLDRLRDGEIDLMPDVAYTAARNDIFDFHEEPLLSSWFQVYARKGSGIRSIVDMHGKRVVVLEGSVQKEAFEQFTGGFGFDITLMSRPDYKAMFEMVASGKADAVVSNNFYGMMHTQKHGLEDTAVIFNPSLLFFAAPKGKNRELLEGIDRHLAEIKKDTQSIYYKSVARWTSEKIAYKLPFWVAMVGIALAALMIIGAVGSFLLKKQVDLRTQELRKINSEIEERIRLRTEELAEATHRAQAADRIKSAFLATMSHELRTPLNSIIGFTGILLQQLAGPLNDEQKKQLGMVQNSSRHLLSLINDILDISKIEAGEIKLSFSPYDLAPSLEKTVQLVKPLADKKGLKLTTEIDASVGVVISDQRRLEQIVINLLNNAVKFTEQGSVAVSCRRKDDVYILTVSDTGPGIKEEDIQGLFQPFHQIDTGISRKYEGSGLGLSICKKLIELMGGTIAVESRWNEGSAFTIRFPAQQGEKI